MRYPTLAIVVSLSYLATNSRCTPPQAEQLSSDMAIVRSFCKKEISKLFGSEDRKPLMEVLARLCKRSSEDKSSIHGFAPAYVWEFGGSKDAPNFLVLERSWYNSIPGTTRIRFTLLGHDEKVIAESAFETGYNKHLTKASLLKIDGSDVPVIDLAAGIDCERQVYGLIGKRFDLIWLENWKGLANRNHYWNRYFDISGLVPPKQSEEQWESDLCRGSRLEVLRALTWLAGARGTGDHSETLEPGAASAPVVRSRPAVAQRLRQLAESSNRWERETAALTLDPKDY